MSATQTQRNLTGISILLLVTAGIIYWWIGYAKVHNLSMDVIGYQGDVTVNGQSLTEDSRSFNAHEAEIKVSDGAILNAQLSDGSFLQVNGNSKLRVTKAQSNRDVSRIQTEFKLDAGEIIRNIPKRKGVTEYSSSLLTSSVDIGVRGTKYVAVADQDVTRTMVHRGEVVLESEGYDDVALTENFGTVTFKGKAPKPPTVLPSPPKLASPEQGYRVEIDEFIVSWEPVENADSYLIEFAKDETFQNVVYRVATADTNFRIDRLPYDANYTWRVASIDDHGLHGRGSSPRNLHYKYHHQQLNQLDDDTRSGKLIELSLAGYENDPALLTDIARYYQTRGHYQESLGYYNRALTRTDDGSQILIERGGVYSMLGQHKQAQDDFNQVLTVDKNNPDALWRLGEDEMMQGQATSAIEYYFKAIASNPEHASAHISAAKVWKQLDKPDKARNHISLHLENYPDDATALELMRSLESAQ
ncbi:MAG: tetratricopeptide repeat protein [Gammaproteobacteria bacterium]|nr:MAG: tetratricopeptide repeat protein [Gammaproteobacteria bacterium]